VTPSHANPTDSPFRTARRVGATVVVFAVAAFLAWRVADVLMAVFGGLLLAVMLDALMQPLRSVRVPRSLALVIVVVLLVGSLVLFWVLAGPALVRQTALLGDQIPQALQRIENALRGTEMGRDLLHPAATDLVSSAAPIIGRVPGMFSTLIGTDTNVAFALLIAVYLAWSPGLYRGGLMHLLPHEWRERGAEVLAELGHALRWWLVGRITAMTAIGLLTGLGLWLIDLPLALVLGVIAGLFAFVPFIGPIASAVPAVLIALGSGLEMVIWVLVIYSAVQFLEGNSLTPIFQQRAVSLPPAVLLTAQLLLGVLFGLVGVLLATPLTVVVIGLVQMLYVRDVLGDPVALLGHRRRGRAPG